MTAPSPGAGEPRTAWPLALLGTALAYAVLGWAALLLAGPPGYASPLYPSAGIALAACLTYGAVAWPGVLLGSLAVNVGLGALRGHSGLALVVLPLVIALGAMLQAALGAWLLRRFIGPQPTLQVPSEVARAAALGAALACLVSASVGTVALVASGTLPAGRLVENWATWWLGDTLGVLIGAPLAWTLIGRPAAEWRPRRLSVGLPLAVALAVLAAASAQSQRMADERRGLAFERRAERLAAAAEGRLKTPLYALQALHGAVFASGRADDATLAAASAWWLRQGDASLRALGYSEIVPKAQIEAFEREAQEAGLEGFRVFQRDEGRALESDGVALVLRRIVPLPDNRGALGVNTLSIPGARAGVLAARDSGEPASSAPFRLTQGQQREIGFVLYQALYEGTPPDLPTRRAAFRGVVFVTVSIENLLAGLQREAGTGVAPLRWCLVDGSGAGATRLAGEGDGKGDGDCDADLDSGERTMRQTLTYGGRPLQLQVVGGGVEADLDASHWLNTLPALAAAALLGALLLTVTGHSRRTERAVQDRTRDLERENAERQHAEAALRQSEQRLRTIVDNAPVGVAFLDPQGTLLEANQHLCAMLGTGASELAGRAIDSLIHEDDRDEIRRLYRELLGGRIAVARRQLRLRRRDGTVLQARAAATALRDEGARVLRIVSVIEDIGEHLRLEQAEHAMHKAEAASRAKSEFVSRMSHELRTPLNAMLGFAQLLTLDHDPALASRQRGWAEEIQRAGWHLLAMINETLDLARIESGDLQLALQPVELAPLLAACRALVANAATQRRVQIVDETPAGLPAAWADPTRTKQVLTNLLSNAIKYNREGGEVLISAAFADGRLRVAVADTGLGMSESQMQGLFQPYNRLGREGTGIEGTGIGLVISRRLTELMGGTLEVRSQPGAGSTFVFTLPPAGAPAEPPSGDTTSPGARYQRRRVLYIEDNETNVEIMRGMLAQRPQIRLDVATLGLDGLGAARQLQPDLVLLDMHLPDISGLELLRHLKQDDDAGSIPVVVVSADATPTRIQQALTLGAARYITKPLDLAELLAAVDEVLESAETRWGL